jgi:hypothetical protein
MPHEVIGRVEYDSDLWILSRPSPLLADLLEAQERLLVLRCGPPPYRVVLGVPHHASVTQDFICQERRDATGRPWLRDADKGSATYALVAFSTLRERGISTKLVVMLHSLFVDPNKVLTSAYCQEVFAEPTALLLECHGAGPQRVLALELSAGSNALAETEAFARALDRGLGRRFTWAYQARGGSAEAVVLRMDGSGDRGMLELPALNTASLTAAAERNIPALHLEAKPAFCDPKDGTNTVTPEGLLLGRALARAIVVTGSGTVDSRERRMDTE